MKPIVAPLIILLLGVKSLKAQNTDLPGPAPGLKTIGAGSYIIAMDNNLQVNSSGLFNLKAYGLIVHLLDNRVKLKWSIKAGKSKDQADFQVMAQALKPNTSGTISLLDFRSGPFLIEAADTVGVAALIDNYYTTKSLTGADRPTVYRTTADVANVDIR